MDKLKVKEALTTALMLSQTASRKHKVEIDCLGEVHIDNNYTAYFSETGELIQLTESNIEERLEELTEESLAYRVKRRVKEFNFT